MTGLVLELPVHHAGMENETMPQKERKFLRFDELPPEEQAEFRKPLNIEWTPSFKKKLAKRRKKLAVDRLVRLWQRFTDNFKVFFCVGTRSKTD